ncbi:MAG: hypothetical protein ABJF10_08310 [Chthoniobacter sp.]|uniref:hypothetical protein n=1 Tax=Chthoniobacter sp. TaxID=2510640 RepID=UPI0032AACFE6
MRHKHPLHLLTLATAFAACSGVSCLAAPAPNAALDAREQRVTLLRDEIKALDQGIEDRIDVLLGALKSVGDSKDSRSKVARMKEDTITALKRNIEYIQRKRDALVEELRRPSLGLTEEQAKRGVAFFNERIEKRVAQIIAIQKSLPTHKDYERYKVTGDTWAGPTYAVNEDFTQNQRVTGYTNSSRKAIEDGLRASMARLDQQKRTLSSALTGADAAHAAALRTEIAKTDALIAERRKQLATALAPVETPTRQIGAREAADLDKALRTSIEDLRRDFTALFARYASFVQEVAGLNAVKGAAAKTKMP